MTKRYNSSLRSSSDRNFEDDEKMAVELKVFIFNTLYQWIVAYEFFHISSIHEFLFINFY